MRLVILLFFITLSTAQANDNTKKCLQFSVYSGLADFKKGYSNQLVEFDRQGVIKYKNTPEDRAYHYNLISRWGLSALKYYCKNNDKEALDSAISQARYLIDNVTKYDGFYSWVFDFPGGGNSAGFSSGISNGATIDLLLHLGYIINDDEMLKYAGMGSLSFVEMSKMVVWYTA